MGKGGEVFILDMGEPVKIVDLARDLIRLSGLEPDMDVEVKITGIRPGEKLFEELSTDEERAEKTLHPKIFIGRVCAANWKALVRGIDDLRDRIDLLEEREVYDALRGLIPEFQGGKFVDGVGAEAGAGAGAGADTGPSSGVPSSGARGDGVAVSCAPFDGVPMACARGDGGGGAGVASKAVSQESAEN